MISVPAGARVLLATRDGALWIGTQAGLAKLQNGRLTTFAELDGAIINGLLEDREGTVWVSVQARGIVAQFGDTKAADPV